MRGMRRNKFFCCSNLQIFLLPAWAECSIICKSKFFVSLYVQFKASRDRFLNLINLFGSGTLKYINTSKMSAEHSNSSDVRTDEVRLRENGISEVCKFFGGLYRNGVRLDENYNYCSKCNENKKLKKYSITTSTTVLSKHLKNHHDILTNEIDNIDDATKFIKQIEDSSYVPKTDEEKKSLQARRNALWYCRGLHSARSFEKEEFIEWCIQNKVIKDKSENPCANTISGRALDDVFHATLEVFKKKIISRVPQYFYVLTDAWTDKYAVVPYINLSIQFIDDDFKFQSYKIFTEEFSRPHTSVRIAEKIQGFLQDLGLSDGKFYLAGKYQIYVSVSIS